MNRNHAAIVFLLTLLAPALLQALAIENPCWFLRDRAPAVPKVDALTDARSILIDNYFRIFYSAGDKRFQEVDFSGKPASLSALGDVFTRARHFIQIELGWKLPATRTELGRPELNVYFVTAPQHFQGTAETKNVSLVFNSYILDAADFPAIFIHQLAHAAELQYRSAGDYWFYEATAAWMEGQFDVDSATTQQAIAERFKHPDMPLGDPSPVLSRGDARFLDLLARPYKDVIRQIWERWSSTDQEPLMDIIQEVLNINHLPSLTSYVQNYFLLFSSNTALSESEDIILQPYSAVVAEGTALQSQGGIRFIFNPAGPASYSASLVFYGIQEKQGTLSMRSGLNQPWSISVPFSGLDHYKLVIVNPGVAVLRGNLQHVIDSSIPAVLEYFRVNPGDGGIQIEWKTSKENGVAFWNLYSIHNGQKQLLNDFPIPASIQSDEGIHYLYFDTSAGALYSLEAITSEGFRSPLAGAEKSQ